MTVVPGSVRFLNVVGGSTLYTVNHGAVGAGNTGYELLAASPSGMQRRRDVVTSPYIDGETEVASVQGARRYGLVIHCVGTTYDEAANLRDVLIAHSQQKTWVLGVTFGSRLDTWDCRAADYSYTHQREYLINSRIELNLDIPATLHGTGVA